LSAASGDRDRNNANLETFYNIFPTGGVLDGNYNVGTGNVLFARLATQVFWTPQWWFQADVAWIARNSLRDGIYGPATNPLFGVPQALTSDARAVGRDVGIGANWIVSRHMSFSLAGYKYFPGPYLRDVRPSNPDAWGTNVTMYYRF
jgi:hypothetical protein